MYGHTLQLSIRKALDLPAVKKVIARCKKCIAHFNKSTKEIYKLREKQKLLKLPEHELIQDCITRWGSTLHMLERIQEQQAAIAAVLMEGRNTHLIPDGEEWVTIDGLISVHKPFQKATEAMSGEKYSTISTVKPLLFKLLMVTLQVCDADSSTTKRIQEAVSSDLSTRYDDVSIKELLNVVTYLDPRYKSLPFLNAAEKTKILQDVESMVMNHVSEAEESTELTSATSSLETEPSGSEGPPTKKTAQLKILSDSTLVAGSRPEPIMLLKLPIMLLSIAPNFPLLCSNYAQLCPIMLQIFSHKLCLDCSIRVFNTSVIVLLGYFNMR